MTPLTLFLYLLGNRRAIETIATDRCSLWIGFLFVLSAAFAREYDGEDLLHEPWYLLLPLVASLITSYVVFVVLFLGAEWGRGPTPRRWRAFRSFLGLFWMTAPLAWLYAVPYERFLDPLEATRANLATLGVVALWRLALMVRVGVVLDAGELGTVVIRILAVADGIAVMAAIGGMILGRTPFAIMGGLHDGYPVEQVLAALNCQVIGCGGLLALPLLLALSATQGFARPRWPAIVHPADGSAPQPRAILYLAISSVVVWAGVLPFTQPEQQHRWAAERLFRSEQYAEMLAELSAHEAADYPPHWQPPPDRFPLVILRDPFLMRIMNALQAQEVSPWVERHYVERFNQSMRRLEDNTGGDIRSLRSELQRLGLGHLGTLRKRFGPAIYLPPGWEEDKGR